ncbi:MAG: hypothetical protein ACI9K1_001967 [Arcticibacterium sp.]|jgi:hypothetical protein
MSILSDYLQKIESKVLGFVSADNWRLKTVILCCFVVVLSFFNNLFPLKNFKTFYDQVITNRSEVFLYETIKDRAGDLTGNFDYEPYSGKESRTFRLVAPVFIKLTGIQHVSFFLYTIQLLCGLLFFYLLTGFVQELTGDRSATLYAMIGISTVYLGSCFLIENLGYGDLFSFFFLFLAVYFGKKPWLVFVFLQLAFWNDERAFIGSGLAFVWLWWYPQFKSNNPVRITLNWSMTAVVLAWLAWIGGRYYLMNVVGMKPTYNPDGEFMVRIQQSFWSLGFRLLWQFEGWWLLFGLMGMILWSKKEYLSLVPILGALAASSLAAMIIYDSTRSGTFAFIAIFFAIAVCKKYLTDRQLRLLLLGTAILCFLHPLASQTRGVGFFLM